MTITSRKPKKEVPTPEQEGATRRIFQIDFDEEPTPEELERIKKVFEQIRDSLDGFYGLG